ncbi:MATE family efflux transporter [Halobacteriales archaeon QH_2_66_30]|nr:MAG: MATE family efflux transporter [Halobacteriales archaeon QH_2_66_30]
MSDRPSHSDDEPAVPDEDGDDPPDGGGPPGGDSGDDEPRESITEGSLVWPLFHLAWPIVVIQLLQVTYNIADTLYLGRLSADAVGALSLAFPLVFLLIAVAGGFTTAGAILVAQYTGAEGDESAGLVVGQTVTFVGFLSVVLGIAGYFYTRPALSILPSDPDTSADVIPLAADYMEIIFLGMPFLFGFFVFSALMRGYGDTRTPMYVMVVSVFANVLLDPFFIFGFDGNPLFTWAGLFDLEASLLSATGFAGFGIEGAAFATIIARGGGTAIGLYLLFASGVGPAVQFSHLRPDLSFIEDIIRLGTPSMVEQSTSALAMVTLTAMVVTFAGQNLGADRADRAERSVWLAASTGAGVMLLVAVVAVLFPEPIVSVFLGDVPNAPATIENGVDYLRVRSTEFAFIGITQVMLGAFRGAGNTKIAMSISIVTLWVGRVGTVGILVFVLGWGATGVWIGMAVGNVVGAAVSVPWFLRGTWREKFIEEENVEHGEVEPDAEDPSSVTPEGAGED